MDLGAWRPRSWGNDLAGKRATMGSQGGGGRAGDALGWEPGRGAPAILRVLMGGIPEP